MCILKVLCVYACANCTQNARFQLMHTIDAKWCFRLIRQNIERQKHYRNFWGDRLELWSSIHMPSTFATGNGPAIFCNNHANGLFHILHAYLRWLWCSIGIYRCQFVLGIKRYLFPGLLLKCLLLQMSILFVIYLCLSHKYKRDIKVSKRSYWSKWESMLLLSKNLT